MYRQIFEIPGFAEATIDKNGNKLKDFELLEDPDMLSPREGYSPKRKKMVNEAQPESESEEEFDDDLNEENTSDSDGFVPNFEIEPEKYLEPDSPENVCHMPNYVLFDSMIFEQPDRLPSEPNEEDVVIHKIPEMNQPFLQKEFDTGESSFLSDALPGEHEDNSTLNFTIF